MRGPAAAGLLAAALTNEALLGQPGCPCVDPWAGLNASLLAGLREGPCLHAQPAWARSACLPWSEEPAERYGAECRQWDKRAAYCGGCFPVLARAASASEKKGRKASGAEPCDFSQQLGRREVLRRQRLQRQRLVRGPVVLRPERPRLPRLRAPGEPLLPRGGALLLLPDLRRRGQVHGHPGPRARGGRPSCCERLRKATAFTLKFLLC